MGGVTRNEEPITTLRKAKRRPWEDEPLTELDVTSDRAHCRCFTFALAEAQRRKRLSQGINFLRSLFHACIRAAHL